jgi:protease II
MEFGADKNELFYTETMGIDRRPYKVVKLNLTTLEKQTLFVDDNPHNWIDISTSKDKKFIVISSNTKEDSEIWVLPRELDQNQSWSNQGLPIKVVSRRKNVTASLWHVRDFFLLLSSEGSGQSKSKSQQILELSDEEIKKSA